MMVVPRLLKALAATPDPDATAQWFERMFGAEVIRSIGGEVAADGTRSGGLKVKREAMERAALKGYATATDLADYLVKKGLPFRDAHEAVGHAVKAAEQKGVDLPQLTLDEIRAFCPQVENDVFSVLTVEGSLASRNHIGGTAPEQVKAAIARARARLRFSDVSAAAAALEARMEQGFAALAPQWEEEYVALVRVLDYLTRRAARWLLSHTAQGGRVERLSCLELLMSCLESARWSPPSSS